MTTEVALDLDPAPTEVLLGVILQVLQEGADIGALGEPPPTIRYWRKSPPNDEDRAGGGCISIRFDGARPRDGGGEGGTLSFSEAIWEMDVALVIDFAIPEDDDDNAGQFLAMRVITNAAKLLRVEDSALKAYIEWVEMGGLEPPEDNPNELSRLEQATSVLYRVDSTDPTVLLLNGAS